MIDHKNIRDYIDYCNSHPERINKDRKLLIKNIILPLLEREDVYLDVVMYEYFLAYCEKHYFKLFPYQKFENAFVFVYYKDTGNPVFNTFVDLMGRGNGKTSGKMPLADFFLTPIHGIEHYNVDIIANNEDQARKDFGIVWERLESNKAKFKKFFKWTKGSIINLATNSELRYNTSNAKTKDGKEGGCLIFDEYHAYENYSQINVFESQLGKIRHPRKFILTTQGYVRGGPLDELLAMCREVLASGNNPLGIFPFLCCIDSKDEIDIEEAWHKANPSAEFMPVLWETIKKQYLEMKQLPLKRSEFITKRLNLPEQDSEQVVATWDDILATNVPLPDLEGHGCVCGIDYANTNDFVGCVLLFKYDDKYAVIHHSFVCANSRDLPKIKAPVRDWEKNGDVEIVNDVEVSPSYVTAWLEEQMKSYKIKKIAIDKYRFQLFNKALNDLGFDAYDYDKSRRNVKLTRKSDLMLIAPVISSVFVSHQWIWGDCPIMRWYTNNTKALVRSDGNIQYEKIEPKLRKTDGFMALASAMTLINEIEVQSSAETVVDIPTMVFSF